MKLMTESADATPIATFDLTVLDTPDPRGLAQFYCALLGWEVEREDDDWVTVRGPGGGHGLAFQLAPDHVPPTWPDDTVPQQIHLDLTVPDLDRGEQQVVALGARVTGQPEQPGGFRAFLDPAGHPFCLCLP